MTDTLPDVIQSGPWGYFVRSASVPGAWRRVLGKDCSCTAGDRQSCRHRRLVAAHVAEENRKHARPVAPPAISMLCD